MIGSEEVLLKGRAHATRVYRTARDELNRLSRYHGIDAASACNLLTLQVVRRTTAGQAARTARSRGREAKGGPNADVEAMASLTLVELPGTERLAEDRAQV